MNIDKNVVVPRLFIELDGAILKQTKKEAIERYRSDFSEDEEDYKKENQLYHDVSATIEEMYMEDDEIHVTMETSLGYISLQLPITENMDINFAEREIKKFNKMKTAMEALK